MFGFTTNADAYAAGKINFVDSMVRYCMRGEKKDQSNAKKKVFYLATEQLEWLISLYPSEGDVEETSISVQEEAELDVTFVSEYANFCLLFLAWLFLQIV